MASRRSGWFLHKLDAYKSELRPAITENSTVRSFRATAGCKNTVSNAVLLLNECHSGTSYSKKSSASSMLKTTTNFFVDPILPNTYNAVLRNNLYLIRSLVARTYRARQMARCKPAHGQRRWSNANTAKRCNTFIYTSVIGYKKDLYNITQIKRVKWSKLQEMRQKAKIKKKAPKKKWTKFKKVGERRLQLKKKKKTPWQ